MKKISIILFALLCFASCKQTEYIKVPQVETIYKTEYVFDSVDRKESHNEYAKGDTIRIVDSVRCDHYHFSHDTLIQHDTIPVIDTAAINYYKAQVSQLQKENTHLQKANRYKNIFLILAFSIIILAISWLVYNYLKNHAKSNS